MVGSSLLTVILSGRSVLEEVLVIAAPVYFHFYRPFVVSAKDAISGGVHVYR